MDGSASVDAELDELQTQAQQSREQLRERKARAKQLKQEETAAPVVASPSAGGRSAAASDMYLRRAHVWAVLQAY